MNILFYLPYNQQVVYIESIAEQLVKNGHFMHLITHDGWGPTHDNFHKFGTKATCLSSPIIKLPLFYHLFRIIQVIKFCRRNKISIVYSHYQESNFISAFAQFFTKAKFVLTRHHSDCATLDSNLKEKIGDYFINNLAKIYITPSKLVYNQVVNIEKTNSKKVHLINYGYNFHNFQTPDEQKVVQIREDYQCEFLMLMAARFIPEKRHAIYLNTIKKLVDQKYDIKVILLGKGPLLQDIKSLITEKKLENHVFILGYKTDIPNYFAAADLIVHLSSSEASNSAIKEAALVETPVMVCENVGDFSDYIRNEENGFLLDKKNPGLDLDAILKERFDKKEENKKIGKKLKKDVLERFEILKVMPAYLQIQNELIHAKN